jgi:hypothetical protein
MSAKVSDFSIPSSIQHEKVAIVFIAIFIEPEPTGRANWGKTSVSHKTKKQWH